MELKDPMEPIEKPPASAQVVERIRRAIQLDRLGAGERLPSEPDLARQLGVSRTTLRAAIRHLAGEGYLESRRGAGGGLFVMAPEGSKAHRLTELRARAGEIEELIDFRSAIECAAARFAALRRTEADLERIEAALEALARSRVIPEFRKADSAFHLTIADAAANEHLRRAVEDVRAAMFGLVDLADFDVMVSNSRDEHRRIADAIAAGNAKKAERAMARHIETAREEIHDVLTGRHMRTPAAARERLSESG
ncbi:MAG: FCD domain-containing protein [Proteobacteria bacterium]|nr:FCD domain-containing protein [Pseudomonadota bacterium]